MRQRERKKKKKKKKEKKQKKKKVHTHRATWSLPENEAHMSGVWPILSVQSRHARTVSEPCRHGSSPSASTVSGCWVTKSSMILCTSCLSSLAISAAEASRMDVHRRGSYMATK
jgi:hypothetical protein